MKPFPARFLQYRRIANETTKRKLKGATAEKEKSADIKLTVAASLEEADKLSGFRDYYC